MLIAQISDLHIRSDDEPIWGRSTLQALDDAVDHILALDPRPDVVVATGDLVDTGSAADYRALREGLARLPMPVYAIPGNHDDRTAMRAAFRDCDYLPADGAFLHYLVDSFPLRLVALDTVIPGEVEGGLCADRLAWLEQILAAAPDRPTLIFMHHPPFTSGISVLDEPPFLNADRMKALIARHPQVRQIACGHIHRAIHTHFAGTTAAVAPSTIYQMSLALRPGETVFAADHPTAIGLYFWRPGFDGPLGYFSPIGVRESVGYGSPVRC